MTITRGIALNRLGSGRLHKRDELSDITGERPATTAAVLENKGLTMKMGQTHVHRYLEPLLKKVEEGEIDPSFVITHRVSLDEVPEAYKTFRDKEDGCIKVVLKP